MKVSLIKKEGEKIELEIDDLGFTDVLNEVLWKKRADYSAYTKDHPILSKPRLVVKSKDSKKSLIDAAEQIAKDADDLRKKFQKAVRS